MVNITRCFVFFRSTCLEDEAKKRRVRGDGTAAEEREVEKNEKRPWQSGVVKVVISVWCSSQTA